MSKKAYKLPRANVRPVVDFADDPGKTQQQFKDECDINFIVNRFLRGDDISHYHRAVMDGGVEQIVPENFDYTQASEIINQTNYLFAQLPAQDRDLFQNDPQNFIDYMENPEQIEDSYKRGYRIRKSSPPQNPNGSNLPAGDPSTPKP